MRALVAWFALHPVAANVLMLVIISMGLLNLNSMRRDTLPEVASEAVVIRVVYPGASASEVEASILRAVEERLVGMEELKELSSSAREGLGTTTAEMLEGSDMDSALAEVRDRVASITTFPQDAETPVISKADDLDLVAFLMLSGNHSEDTLREWGQRVEERLLSEGVAGQVLIDGIRSREFHIDVDPQRLAQLGLSMETLSAQLRRQMIEVPAGLLRNPKGEYQLRVAAKRQDSAAYAQVVVASDGRGGVITLGDIATIRDSYAEQPLAVRFQGQSAIQLTVLKDRSQDVLRVNNALTDFLRQANHHQATQQAGWLPPTMQLQRTFAWADLVQSRLDLLVDNGLMGLALVFVALWVFTNIRVALWVGAGLAVALLGTMWLLQVQGMTINMISMFALIMAVGILVDDAIIVAENIYARLEAGDGPQQAVVGGTHQVLLPIIGATATSAAAFLPLATVPGAVGDFMVVLPLTIVAGLTFSLIESFLILPRHLLHAMRVKHVQTRRQARAGQPAATPSIVASMPARLRGGIDAAMAWTIRALVRPVAKITVRFRYVVLSCAAAGLLLCLGLVRGGVVPWTFFMTLDGDLITVSLRFTSGTPAATTAAQVSALEESLQQTLEELVAEQAASGQPERQHPVKHITTMVGSLPSTRGTSREEGSHVAGIIVGLTPNEERQLSASQIMNRWQALARDQRLPGLRSLRIEGMETGPGGADIDIRFSAPSWEALQQTSESLRRALDQLQGVSNIEDNLLVGTPELRLRPSAFGRSVGIDESLLAQVVRGAGAGNEVFRLQVGRDEVVVRLRAERAAVVDQQYLYDLPISTAAGSYRLHEVSVISQYRPIAQINRFNRERVVTITADLDTTTNTDGVLTALGRSDTGLRSDSTLDRLAREQGARYLFEGVAATQATTMDGIRRGMILAVVTIYLILVLAFKSWLQPLVILAIVPVGLIGAILGHLVLGLHLTIISVFGIVGLTGIVVNDAITFIHFVNSHRQAGLALPSAVVQAICQRFRPIMMTTVTTVLGLLPLLLETSTQALFLIPMAAAISFGLIASTVGTLVIIPALYVILYDLVGLVSAWRRGIDPLHHLHDRRVP